MAVVRRRGEKFELRLKHRLLPKLFTATFDSETDARNYGNQLKAMLAQGLVPRELVARRAPGVSSTLAKVIHEYEGAVRLHRKDLGFSCAAREAAVRGDPAFGCWAQWIGPMRP